MSDWFRYVGSKTAAGYEPTNLGLNPIPAYLPVDGLPSPTAVPADLSHYPFEMTRDEIVFYKWRVRGYSFQFNAAFDAATVHGTANLTNLFSSERDLINNVHSWSGVIDQTDGAQVRTVSCTLSLMPTILNSSEAYVYQTVRRTVLPRFLLSMVIFWDVGTEITGDFSSVEIDPHGSIYSVENNAGSFNGRTHSIAWDGAVALNSLSVSIVPNLFWSWDGTWDTVTGLPLQSHQRNP